MGAEPGKRTLIEICYGKGTKKQEKVHMQFLGFLKESAYWKLEKILKLKNPSSCL